MRMTSLSFNLCENGTFESNAFETIRIIKEDADMSCAVFNSFSFKLDSLRDDLYRITRVRAYEKIEQSTL